MARRITLTKGRFAIVEDEDYESISKFKWTLKYDNKTNNIPYAYRLETYYNEENKRKRRIILMHRAIIGAEKGQIVDHINRNSLDNRRSNLRICTALENSRNSNRLRSNSNGYRGVLRSPYNRYRAQINVSGETIMSKYVDTAEDAAKIYDTMARKYFGSTAICNF